MRCRISISTIDDGEFVALLGPSGCGKTSTLRMIVGLETITSGDILVRRHPRQRSRSPERATWRWRSRPMRSIRTSRSRRIWPFRSRCAASTSPSAASGPARSPSCCASRRSSNEKPPSLSGGQQQRVSLGRALIRDPAVFILDEVMSHLDAHLKFQMLFDLKRLHRALRRTMIYVTHDQVEALALADRVAVMSECAGCSRSAPATNSTTARPTCSSPISSASRRPTSSTASREVKAGEV